MRRLDLDLSALPDPSAAYSSDISLGPEEQEHHAALIALEQDVTTAALRSIQEAANGGARLVQQTNMHLLERAVQDQFAAMRGRIRDLELLTEEQDT